MSQYRILEIPQPDGGNKYRIQIREFKKKSFWIRKNTSDKYYENWVNMNVYGEPYRPNIHRPIYGFLEYFDTLDKAKSYLDYLQKEIKVVYTTNLQLKNNG